MNRRNKKILFFVLILAAFVMLGLWLQSIFKFSPLIWVGLAVLFMIPGRIAAYHFKPLMRGTKEMNQEKWEQAEPHLKRFIDTIEQKPWIKKLMRFQWGFYTDDIEAMTYNNLGAVYLETGKFAEARKVLEKALEIDPKYSKSYFNMAIVEHLDNHPEKAEELYNTSVELGFANTTFDQIIGASQTLWAKFNS